MARNVSLAGDPLHPSLSMSVGVKFHFPSKPIKPTQVALGLGAQAAARLFRHMEQGWGIRDHRFLQFRSVRGMCVCVSSRQTALTLHVDVIQLLLPNAVCRARLPFLEWGAGGSNGGERRGHLQTKKVPGQASEITDSRCLPQR